MGKQIPVVVDPLVEDETEEPSCPACGGPGMSLGTLGKTRWSRCRNCGTDFKGGN